MIVFMLRSNGLTRVVSAPPRGGYDRARTPAERHAQQRERLLLATAEMFDGRTVTVSRIVAHAGVSRNTFYEHFDDAEHALASVTQRALELFSRAAVQAATASRTPFDELRALARAWMEVVEQHPDIVELGLRSHESSASLSAVGAQFLGIARTAIERARRDALVVAEPQQAALVAAAGSAEALARSVIHGESTIDSAARALFDVLARTLH